MKKGLGVLMDKKLDMSQQCALAPTKLTVCWAASTEGWQQGEGGDHPPLLCHCEDSSVVLCPGQGPPAQEGCEAVGVGPEEGHEDDQGAGAPFL